MIWLAIPLDGLCRIGSLGFMEFCVVLNSQRHSQRPRLRSSYHFMVERVGYISRYSTGLEPTWLGGRRNDGRLEGIY